MSDPTQRISQLLHDAALRAPSAGRMPARVVRRARLAMARTAFGAVILIAVAVSAGVIVYGNLGEHRAAAPVGQPSSSPETIAFVSDRDGDADIYSAVIGEEQATNLTGDDASDVSPSWSPDGSEIAFSSDRSGEWDVYVMRADGSDIGRAS